LLRGSSFGLDRCGGLRCSLHGRGRTILWTYGPLK
jgi:hypothetical protein